MKTHIQTQRTSTTERPGEQYTPCVGGVGRGKGIDHHPPVCVAYPQPDGQAQRAEAQRIRVHIGRLLIAFDFPRVAALSGEEGAR